MRRFIQHLHASIVRDRIGFHTIWTRPKDGNFSMEDFEMITLIVSALTWKSHNGPIWLYTDGPGADWIFDRKLGWLYDQIHTELDAIPSCIDARMFWAAGKLFAYKKCRTPCVSIDYDAVAWSRLPNYLNCDAIALHPEPVAWSGYRNTRRLNLLDPSLDWDTEAANTGIVAFNNPRLKEVYCESAIDFVKRYSDALKPSLRSPTNYIDEMIFAEQHLLTLVARKMRMRMGYFGEMSLRDDHLVRNDAISHLWNSKAAYRNHDRARDHYISYMLKFLLINYPESLPALRHLNLLQSVITDANVPVDRYAPAGDWVLPGETMSKI